MSQKRGFYIQYGAKVWDCEMAPLEIYCYHRPLLHLFAWIRLYSVSSRLEFLFPQKKGRKQAHIFSGTFEVCLIFCKIGSEEQLSNVKRLSIRSGEICWRCYCYFFFPFSTNDSFPIQKLKDRKDKSVVVVGFYARRLNKYQLTNLDSIHFLSLAK